MSNRVEDLQEEIEILSAYKIAYKKAMRENQRYKQALSFYADNRTWIQEHIKDNRYKAPIAMQDEGYRARKALEIDAHV